MSEAKHTPGPWWSSGLEVGTVPMMHVKVARVSGQNYEEALANARLITTTPELLESLKVAVSRIKDLLEADDGQAYKEARKALSKMESVIAKATGQS